MSIRNGIERGIGTERITESESNNGNDRQGRYVAILGEPEA